MFYSFPEFLGRLEKEKTVYHTFWFAYEKRFHGSLNQRYLIGCEKNGLHMVRLGEKNFR